MTGARGVWELRGGLTDLQRKKLDCLDSGSTKQPANVPQAPGGRLPSRITRVMSLLCATCFSRRKLWTERRFGGKRERGRGKMSLP